jgi:hypothetical protein
MLADEIRRILESLDAPYCLIGGQALAARGYPRFTVDYDFLTSDKRVLERDVWNTLAPETVIDPRKGDYDDPLAGVVHITTNQEDADVILAKWKWELDVILRAERLDVEGIILPVPRTSDLILLKLAAGGLLDLNDAAVLLNLDPETLIPEVEQHLPLLRPEAQAEWRKIVDSTATSG